MESATTGIGVIPEPAVATSKPWKLTAALAVCGAALAVGGLAVATNPWSLVVLRSKAAVGTVVAIFGGICCNVAIYRLRPALPFGRAARQVGLGLAALATILGVVLAAGLALAGIFGFSSEINSTVLRVDHDTAVVRVEQQYGLGPDSACVWFEVREGTGWSTRYRQVGKCMDLELGWTATLDGDVLTLAVGRTTMCTYRVDGPRRSLQPLVTDGCESFGV